MRRFLLLIWLFVLSALLPAGCGGGDGKPEVVDERDGAELTALMQKTYRAVKDNDAAAFDSLFFSPQQADKIWKRIEKAKDWRGKFRVVDLMEAPELERAVPTIHVDKLTLQAWFYFPEGDKRYDKLFSTKWTFVRNENKWGLEDIYINYGLHQYGDVMNDLRQMSRLSFQAMAMDWEEGIDPTPVLDRMYRALTEGDVEVLKACTVDGTLFSASSMNVAMPGLATGSTSGGKYNRKISQDGWEHNIRNIKDFSANMGVTPEFLRPYFGAYRITSMPSKCTKVLMRMEYSGKRIPEMAGKIGKFRLSWSAARTHQRWLAESMYVESIEGYQ